MHLLVADINVFQTELASREENPGAIPYRFYTLLPTLTCCRTLMGKRKAPFGRPGIKGREGWEREQERLEDPKARAPDRTAPRT